MATRGKTRAATLALAGLCTACSFDTWPLRGGDDGYERPGDEQAMVAVTTPDTDFANPAGGASARPGTAAQPVADASVAMQPELPDASIDPPDSGLPPAVAPTGTAVEAEDSGAAAIDAGGAAADAMPPDATAPAPGTLFGSCSANADCTMGLICTSSLMPFTANPRGYCTAFCGSNGASAGDACPQPTSGTVRAVCRADVFLCQLESCERSSCPNGLRCVSAQDPLGTGQLVYSCQP